MNDKTDVTLAVAVKPIGAKAQYILYIRKTKGFFFPSSSYCFLMQLHQTCPYSSLRIFLLFFNFILFLNFTILY